jgi:hypothetical protein
VTTSRTLIGCSVFVLALSALVGVLNTGRTRGLRDKLIQSETARKTEEQLRAAGEKELQGREAAIAAANARFAETTTRVASVEADLTKAQTEKNDLETKLRANDTLIAQLRTRIEKAEEKPASGSPAAPASTAELQAQLENARQQLAAAEREKALLSDTIKSSQERSAQLDKESKRRPAGGGDPGIRGKVLAVNQAYNFVVLNLGGRQGVEAHTEMLVLRGGSFIGKIRISSVEPATAIGDIVSSSLARGVQVQTGDTVIYAGTNF